MNATPSWREPYLVVTPEGVQVVYTANWLAVVWQRSWIMSSS